MKTKQKKRVKFGSALLAEEDSSEAAFPIETEVGSSSEKAKSRSLFKPCPLKCGVRFHKFGSIFACPQFRDASMDEKWEIVNKGFICSNCLQRKQKPHNCQFKRSCRFCKGPHNFLLCKKKNEEVAMLLGNIEEESLDDPELDHESIFMSCANLSIGASADNASFQAEGIDDDEEEFVGLVDDLDEESLPSDNELDTVNSVMMAVTEKRRMLGIEIEAKSGKMETIGEMPIDVGRNYI